MVMYKAGFRVQILFLIGRKGRGYADNREGSVLGGVSWRHRKNTCWLVRASCWRLCGYFGIILADGVEFVKGTGWLAIMGIVPFVFMAFLYSFF